jgi:hypothetical protein
MLFTAATLLSTPISQTASQAVVTNRRRRGLKFNPPAIRGAVAFSKGLKLDSV